MKVFEVLRRASGEYFLEGKKKKFSTRIYFWLVFVDILVSCTRETSIWRVVDEQENETDFIPWWRVKRFHFEIPSLKKKKILVSSLKESFTLFLSRFWFENSLIPARRHPRVYFSVNSNCLRKILSNWKYPSADNQVFGLKEVSFLRPTQNWKYLHLYT